MATSLNNLSEQEKNSIREQHTKVINDIFTKLLKSKPLLSEQKSITTSAQPERGKNHGPYCKVGQSQGTLKQHTTAVSGPNVKMGETGFGLFDSSGKMICMISTKFPQGGYIATSS